MKLSYSISTFFGILVVCSFAPSLGAKETLRADLRYDTRTKTPRLVGVRQLTPVLPGEIPTYYRRMDFEGGSDYAKVSSSALNPYEQRQSIISGYIQYGIDALTGEQTVTSNAKVMSGVVAVRPWNSTAEFGIAPVLTVAPALTMTDYLPGTDMNNNPLAIPVIHKDYAADDNVFHYALFGGQFFDEVEWQNYRRMRLTEADSPSDAIARAQWVYQYDARIAGDVTTIGGTAAGGSSTWTIRDVKVTARIHGPSCGGEIVRTEVYFRRRFGELNWTHFTTTETPVNPIAASAGTSTDSFNVPRFEGYETRLDQLYYDSVGHGCNSGNCSVAGGLAGGSHGPTNGSIRWDIPLGMDAEGRGVGYLRLHSERVVPALYTPSVLTLALREGAAEVMRDQSGVVRQLLTSSALVDVVTTGAEAYELRFYRKDQAGLPGIDGVRAITGSPYLTWRVENPGLGGSGQFRVTRIVGSEQVVTLIDDSDPNRTVFSEANGLRVTETLRGSENGDRTELITIRDAVGVMAAKTKVYYRTFDWGEEKVKEIMDPDGAALATEWTYVTSANHGAYRRVASIKRPNGFIETFNYANDLTGKLNYSVDLRFKGWEVRTLHEASRIDLNGDGLLDDLVTTTENFNLSVLSRVHTIDYAGEIVVGGVKYRLREERRSLSGGNSAWNDPTNVVTRYRLHAEGPQAGEIAYQMNPDGILRLRRVIANADGGATTVEESGVADPTGEMVVDGTRTSTTLTVAGRLVESSVVDIASGRQIYSQVVGQADAWGRPLRILHLDGAEEIISYCGSCGSIEQRTLRGESTSYEYDALGRRVRETRRAGSTTMSVRRFEYDAAGRTTRTWRVNPADGTETLLASSDYDPAGRKVADTTLGQGTTTYSHAFGTFNSVITTATMPDGGTRIETRGPDGSLHKLAGSTVAHVDYGWRAKDTSNGSGAGYVLQTRRYYDATNTALEETYHNMLGEVEAHQFADGNWQRRYFDALGRPVRETDPDGVTTLFAYDALGRRDTAAVDMNGNNTIDINGTDRVTRTREEVALREGTTVRRVTTEMWESDGDATPTVASVVENSVDNLRTWQATRGLTATSTTAFDGIGGRTVTSIAPDGTQTIQSYLGERLVSAVTSHPLLGQLSSSSQSYDDLGRLESTTDARNGTTHYLYDGQDRLQSVTAPDPDPAKSGPGYDPQVTAYGYDAAGRVASVTAPDGAVTTTAYYPTGQPKRVSGGRNYPVEYTYDIQLRLKTLTTWQNFAADSGKAVTTWNYDPQRGWLVSKRYADNTGPSYAYKPSGRLQTRIWARTPTVITTYSYNAAGDLAGIDYSDATPDVTYAYDRAGRPKTITDASGTRDFTYHSSGQLEDETYTAGVLAGLTVDRSFDSLARLTAVSALNAQSSALSPASYSYDAASRLQAVTAGANSATYAYLANSPLVQGVTLANNGATRLTTTKSYDNLNRLASIVSQPSALNSQLSAAYTYNSANQRTRATREDSRYWDYGYDALGQVNSAVKKLADGTPLPAHRFGFSYDDIGNRRTATTGTEAQPRVSTHSSNLLNQYRQRTVPGFFELLAMAEAGSTVTFRYPAAAPPAPLPLAAGGFSYREVPVDNAVANVWAPVKLTGVRNLAGPSGEDAVTEVTAAAYVPRTPELLTHDADGNLTADGRWTYTWDAENRLLGLETGVAAQSAGAPRLKLEFGYDSQGRRLRKSVTTYRPPELSPVTAGYHAVSAAETPEAPVLLTQTFPDWNLDWAVGQPLSPPPSGNWIAQLRGTITAPVGGQYQLEVTLGPVDACRLYLDEALVLNLWNFSGPRDGRATVTLQAGRAHALRCEFFNGGSTSSLRLRATAINHPGETRTTRFVHDGWNVIAELDATNADTPVRTCVWGTDLSGTLQGAGGVGGLLFTTLHSSQVTSHTPCYDGNGNVIAYVDLATGNRSATYEYGAFGETLIADGVAAEAMPYKFSTKYTDAETGHIDFGLRIYIPPLGRFANHDPIDERGGLNIYAFVRNDAVNGWDLLGLCPPGYVPFDEAARNELKQRRIDYYARSSAYGDVPPSLEHIRQNTRWQCQEGKEICVRKNARTSERYESTEILTPWKLTMAIDAVSNYLSSNNGRSMWQRTIRENFRQIEEWDFVKQISCCFDSVTPTDWGLRTKTEIRKFDSYAYLTTARLKTDQFRRNDRYQIGYGTSFVDGINFNVTVSPPPGGFEDPGYIDRAIPDPPK